MNHLFDAAPVGHPGVVVKGLERFAGAVGLGVGFSILAVGGGAGVAALCVLPGGERAVGSAFLHFHGFLRAAFNIKRGLGRRFLVGGILQERNTGEKYSGKKRGFDKSVDF